jgi:hypothetical protein
MPPADQTLRSDERTPAAKVGPPITEAVRGAARQARGPDVPPDAPRVYTTAQVGEIIHRGAYSVRALIQEGRLRARWDANRWLVTAEDLDDYLASLSTERP